MSNSTCTRACAEARSASLWVVNTWSKYWSGHGTGRRTGEQNRRTGEWGATTGIEEWFWSHSRGGSIFGGAQGDSDCKREWYAHDAIVPSRSEWRSTIRLNQQMTTGNSEQIDNTKMKLRTHKEPRARSVLQCVGNRGELGI